MGGRINDQFLIHITSALEYAYDNTDCFTGCRSGVLNKFRGGKLMGRANGKLAIGYKRVNRKQSVASGWIKEPIFFSYDGSFSIFSYAYASQSYDAFFFYHKAYYVNVFMC
jgi:hypothetical protein